MSSTVDEINISLRFCNPIFLEKIAQLLETGGTKLAERGWAKSAKSVHGKERRIGFGINRLIFGEEAKLPAQLETIIGWTLRMILIISAPSQAPFPALAGKFEV
jgi:hypothetical protein